jgi:hypothetical protein
MQNIKAYCKGWALSLYAFYVYNGSSTKGAITMDIQNLTMDDVIGMPIPPKKDSSRLQLEANVKDVYKWLQSDCRFAFREYEDVGDWLARATYDQNYLFNSQGEMLEVHLMVAGGGPTIWVEFNSADGFKVIGTWGSDRVTQYGHDNLGVFDYFLNVAPPAFAGHRS